MPHTGPHDRSRLRGLRTVHGATAAEPVRPLLGALCRHSRLRRAHLHAQITRRGEPVPAAPQLVARFLLRRGVEIPEDLTSMAFPSTHELACYIFGRPSQPESPAVKEHAQ